MISLCVVSVKLIVILYNRKMDLLVKIIIFSKGLSVFYITYVLYALFFFICEAIGTAATPGLLCQPRVTVKVIVEKQLECRLTGETEVLGENLPQRHFCPSQNPT
jgi:hypothetical protein